VNGVFPNTIIIHAGRTNESVQLVVVRDQDIEQALLRRLSAFRRFE